MQSAQIRMTTLIDYTSKVKNYIIKPLGDMHMGLFNKQDQVTDEEPIRDFKADYTLAVSAKKGTGLEELKEN